jgi:hypothetical protein
MAIRVDENGKVFTDIVNKTQVDVVIQTLEGQLYGTVHLQPDHRLIDELNDDPAFLAVTNVRRSGRQESAFLALNKAHILWIAPEADLSDVQHGG